MKLKCVETKVLYRHVQIFNAAELGGQFIIRPRRLE